MSEAVFRAPSSCSSIGRGTANSTVRAFKRLDTHSKRGKVFIAVPALRLDTQASYTYRTD